MISAILFAIQVATATPEPIDHLIWPPLSIEESMVQRLQERNGFEDFVNQVTAPVWADARERLMAANPGKAEAVDTALANARPAYFQVISDIAARDSARWLERLPPRLRVVGQGVEERATAVAASSEAQELVQVIPGESVICVLERDVRGCDVLIAKISDLTQGNSALSSFAALLLSSRLGAMLGIQLSLDSGDPMSLVEKRFVREQGLIVPGEEPPP